jgi:isocitrate/isopropylmalate dehydrogenase
MPRRPYRIAVIPGDGIGTEVVDAALSVLDAAANASGQFTIEPTLLPWGTTFYKETGSYLPDDFASILHQFEAVLFGAVGSQGNMILFQVRKNNPY